MIELMAMFKELLHENFLMDSSQLKIIVVVNITIIFAVTFSCFQYRTKF